MKYNKEYFKEKIRKRSEEYKQLSDEEKQKLAETAKLMSDKSRSEMLSNYELGSEYFFFYGKNSPFSQWYKCNFTINDVTFMCTEQYMIYRKALLFNDNKIAKTILESGYNPKKHKQLGSQVAGFDESIWENNKREIVYMGNLHKFIQNPKLFESLMETNPELLVEANPTDAIWGIGLSVQDERRLHKENWCGENLLGKILTQVRNDILRIYRLVLNKES